MAIPDPSLGLSADFDSTLVGNALRFAMQLGAPPDESKRAKFVFASTSRIYKLAGVEVDAVDVMLDREGKPLNPDIEVLEAAPVVKSVDCALEIVKADANELPVGAFRPTKAIVTLLEAEYAQVAGCKELRYNGDRYLYGYEPEAAGLFDLGVHTIVFYCLDDS